MAPTTRHKARLASASADFDKARVDLQRREAAAGTNSAVSGEELTTARRCLRGGACRSDQAGPVFAGTLDAGIGG